MQRETTSNTESFILKNVKFKELILFVCFVFCFVLKKHVYDFQVHGSHETKSLGSKSGEPTL